MDDMKRLSDLGPPPLEGTTYRHDFRWAIDQKRKLVENRNGHDPDDHAFMKRMWAEKHEPELIKAYETAACEMREKIEKGALDHSPEKVSEVSQMLDKFEADLTALKNRLAQIPCEYDVTFH